MLSLFLLLFISIPCSLSINPSKEVAICGKTTFNREQLMECAFRIADMNPKDGRISPQEIEMIKTTYMHWWERTLGWLKAATRTSHIMKECDYNRDGFIDRHDFDKTYKTCIPAKNKRGKPSSSLCQAKKICDRASKLLRKKTYD